VYSKAVSEGPADFSCIKGVPQMVQLYLELHNVLKSRQDSTTISSDVK